jgi:hypothetical protein
MQPKLYPNLNPAAAIPVDRDQVFHLDSFFDQYRLHRCAHHGHYVPNSRYIFVRLATGETLMHPTYRHPALAEGRAVHYAGEAFFDNGRLRWWSNGSGNYRPDPEHAEQAGLPMERFYTYDQIMKGAHQIGDAGDSRREQPVASVQTRGVYRQPPAGSPVVFRPPAASGSKRS